MSDPYLRRGAYCICLDDPLDAIRQLVVESIDGTKVTVLRDHLLDAGKAIPIAVDRLFYNPYRNRYARLTSPREVAPDELQSQNRAMLLRVVVGHLAADGKPIELAKLTQSLSSLLPAFPAEFIDGCLRSMASSGALTYVPPKKKTKKPSTKINLRASEDVRRSEQVSAFAFSFANELLSQSKRFGQLVVHRGTTGGYREELLRALLRRTLAERYHVATGFIQGCDLQLDVIIYDRIEYAPIFREGDLVVVSMDSVRAVIEVKTTLTTQTLQEALEHLNCLPLEVEAPIFKGVFAFDTDIADDRLLGHVAKYYEGSEALWAQPYEEVSAICVLEKQLVLTGYGRNPVRPILSLVRSLIGRNFQAAAFVDILQDYLRTPAPRSIYDRLSRLQLIELSANSRDYLKDAWEVAMENAEDFDGGEGSRQRILRRISKVSRWLSGEAHWEWSAAGSVDTALG